MAAVPAALQCTEEDLEEADPEGVTQAQIDEYMRQYIQLCTGNGQLSGSPCSSNGLAQGLQGCTQVEMTGDYCQ